MGVQLGEVIHLRCFQVHHEYFLQFEKRLSELHDLEGSSQGEVGCREGLGVGLEVVGLGVRLEVGLGLDLLVGL